MWIYGCSYSYGDNQELGPKSRSRPLCQHRGSQRLNPLYVSSLDSSPAALELTTGVFRVLPWFTDLHVCSGAGSKALAWPRARSRLHPAVLHPVHLLTPVPGNSREHPGCVRATAVEMVPKLLRQLCLLPVSVPGGTGGLRDVLSRAGSMRLALPSLGLQLSPSSLYGKAPILLNPPWMILSGHKAAEALRSSLCLATSAVPVCGAAPQVGWLLGNLTYLWGFFSSPRKRFPAAL